MRLFDRIPGEESIQDSFVVDFCSQAVGFFDGSRSCSFDKITHTFRQAANVLRDGFF
ncbi:hypothetical protein HanIR_Chr15g0755221 [Helianthus annuus]|nr:hypothetical protein HanIR_Chr15g0755221 [Helianthus annuus]